MITADRVYPAFVTLFRDSFGLDEEEFTRWLSAFSIRRVRKREFLLEPGEIARRTNYVNLGCFRTYTVDANGKEHILYFSFEDWWIGDIESFHTDKPSTLFIQAIEDSEVLQIDRDDFLRLRKEIPKVDHWYTQKTQRAYFASITRLNDAKTGTPEERYLKLKPEILQRVPQQYIASYLDIEPQSLSRLRNRLTKRTS